MFDHELLFCAISILPRPIPTNVLCELCNVSIKTLQSISVDCLNGFYISGTDVLLKDEDFEAFMRRSYGDRQASINSIAEHMYTNRNRDSYCATYVHLSLDQANYVDRLIEIALNERIDDIVSVAETNKIMRKRIQAALRRPEMSNQTNNQLACMLVYRLIDYNTKEDMLRDFLMNAPEEALLYCDELSVRDIFRTESNDFDSLAKAAFIFSHFPAFHDNARHYINSYMAEIKHYYNASADKRKGYLSPRTDDIIRIAQAMLNLGANKKMLNWICGWQPRVSETEFVFTLFSKLLGNGDAEHYDLLLSQKWAGPNKLAVVCACISLGKEPPQNYVDYLLKLFRCLRTIPVKRFNIHQFLLFAEYILSIKGKEAATKLIEKVLISTRFSSIPYLYRDEEKQEFFCFLKYCALSYVCKGEVVDFDSYWLNETSGDSKHLKENKQSFKQMVDFLFPLFVLRLDCIQSNTDTLTKCKKFVQELEHRAWSYSSYERKQLFETGLLIFSEALSYAKTFGENTISELIKTVLSIYPAAPQFKLKMLEALSRNTQAVKAVLLLLGEIDNCYKDYPASAREMTEVFLSCAQICRRIHMDLGIKYFKKALDSTKGQDYESYRKLYLYKTLSEKISSAAEDCPELAYNIIRLSEDFCRKQGDTKNFPYEEAIGAAALLSPQSIWGALCRLDDRDNYDGFSLMDAVPIVLSALLGAGKLSIEDIVALSGLLLPDRSFQYNELVDSILFKVVARKPSEQKPILEILIHDVLYNIPMDEKRDRSLQISRFLEANVIDPDLDTRKIVAMSSFLEKNLKGELVDYQEESKAVSSINVEQYLAEHDIALKRDMENFLIPLKEPDRSAIIKAWLESRQPDQYASSLSLILDVLGENHSYSRYWPVLETIADFVDLVKDWPEVNHWRNDPATQQHYLHLFAKNFLHLYRGYEDVCDTVLRIFPADYEMRAHAFSSYVAKCPTLYDEQLVKAICHMSMALSSKDAAMLLQWATKNEMEHIHPASGDAKPYDALKKGLGDSLGTKSNFIWRLLGHKDKGIRWKAAHVLLRSAILGNLDITRDISKLYDQPLSEWYMDEGNYFFADSAKLWYLASCSRITKMNPENLFSLYTLFKGIALANGVTHALHRRLAKEICLMLAPICDPDAIEQFILCDKCILDKDKSEKPLYPYEQTSDVKKTEVSFRYNGYAAILVLSCCAIG